MIEYVLATEFDNRQGTSIVAAYPPRPASQSDHLLADYLIPDGMHRTDKDIYVFRSVLSVTAGEMEKEANEFNQLQIKANLYIYRANERQIFDGADPYGEGACLFKVEIMQQKFLVFHYTKQLQKKNKVFFIHGEMSMRQLSERVYSIRAEDGSVHLVEFESKSDGQKVNSICNFISNNLSLKKYLNIDRPDVVLKSGWFFCYCSNKKDSTAERGTVYRSLALFSTKINIFEFFRQNMARTMDIFQSFSPKPMWTDNEFASVNNCLKYLYQEVNSLCKPEDENALLIENTTFLNPTFPKEIVVHITNEPQRVKVYPRLFGTSSKVLLESFGVSTMVIYRALLKEANIVFYGDKTKVERICSMVTAALNLICPLNIVDKIYPFEHVQSINILRNVKGFVVGFTNPIVTNPKVLNWDYLVDLNAGTVMDTSMKPCMIQYENDQAFAEIIIKRIKEDELDGSEVDALFFEYTKTNLEMLLNRSNVIRFDKEDQATIQSILQQSEAFKQTQLFTLTDIYHKHEREEFQSIFFKNYLGVYQAYKLFCENDRFDDASLIVAFESLRLNLTSQDKMDFFLKKLIDRLGSPDCMMMGLYSSDEMVRSLNQKVLELLQGSKMWADFASSSSLFTTLVLSDTSEA